MKKAMLLLLTLLLCFPLQGSVSAAQNVQGQLISRLERVRERRPALPRTLEKNRQQRQAPESQRCRLMAI